MTSLAPILQRFFTDHLITQRKASPHTVRSYKDTFRLLLAFAAQRTGTPPWKLELGQLDADLIGTFLTERQRQHGNSAATRNTRLAAIHSLFGYAAMHAPQDAATIQRVMAIPTQRAHTTIMTFLDQAEAAAVLAAPDQATWIGRRDHTLIRVALDTGLRVSELTAATVQDVHLGTGPHIRCTGKGRRDRVTPLTPAATAALRAWLEEYRGRGNDPLFPTSRGRALSPDGVRARLAKYRTTASTQCPALAGKPLSPHALRHSLAMDLLRSGVDIAVIALWLGHQNIRSTQRYIHADMALKEQALARLHHPEENTPARFQPADPLLTFLENL